MGVIVSGKGEKENSGVSSQCTTFISNLFKVFEKAETMGCITEDLACQHISFYLQLGKVDEARKLAEKLCHEKFSDSIKLQLLKATVEIRHVTGDSVSPSKADLLSIYGLIKDVLTKASISKAESLWLMEYFDKVVEIAIVALAKDRGSDDGFSLSAAIVDFVFQNDGIQKARECISDFFLYHIQGLLYTEIASSWKQI